MNRYYTHVHSLFETGIGARILLTDDSIKANLEVRDKVETIRHLSGVRLNDRQEEQLESAIKRLGQLWYAQKHWPGPGPHVQQALTATFACVSRRRRGGGGGVRRHRSAMEGDPLDSNGVNVQIALRWGVLPMLLDLACAEVDMTMLQDYHGKPHCPTRAPCYASFGGWIARGQSFS